MYSPLSAPPFFCPPSSCPSPMCSTAHVPCMRPSLWEPLPHCRAPPRAPTPPQTMSAPLFVHTVGIHHVLYSNFATGVSLYNPILPYSVHPPSRVEGFSLWPQALLLQAPLDPKASKWGCHMGPVCPCPDPPWGSF